MQWCLPSVSCWLRHGWDITWDMRNCSLAMMSIVLWEIMPRWSKYLWENSMIMSDDCFSLLFIINLFMVCTQICNQYYECENLISSINKITLRIKQKSLLLFLFINKNFSTKCDVISCNCLVIITFFYWKITHIFFVFFCEKQDEQTIEII